MAKKEIEVKKYVVKLSAEERERLEVLIHAGKRSARMLTKARILLKADVSEAGEGWRDSEIAAALDTSVNKSIARDNNWSRSDRDDVEPQVQSDRLGREFSTGRRKRN